MRPETLNGLQERAEMFLENCLAVQGRDPDVYVGGRNTVIACVADLDRFIYIVLHWMEHRSISLPHMEQTHSATRQIWRSWKRCRTMTVLKVW